MLRFVVKMLKSTVNIFKFLGENVVKCLKSCLFQAGFGVAELVRNLKENDTDDYSALLAQALADRLGEAMAEKMHFDVRREFWGYEGAKDGGPTMSASDLHKIKYQGIRPAPGLSLYVFW